MYIIGLGHKARQGKDTVARYIVQECGKKDIYTKQYGFADAVKMYCRMNFGMQQKNGPLLQMVGTDLIRRFVHPNYWIDQLAYRLEDENPDIAVITDTRFWNEAKYIAEQDGLLLRIERYVDSGGVRVRYRATDRVANHPSETDLDDFIWDETIINQSSLDDLRLTTIDVLRKFDIL